MQWINTKDKLPQDNEIVIICIGKEVHLVHFCRGISSEEREKMDKGELPNPVETIWRNSEGYIETVRSKTFKFCDEWLNNEVPYAWISLDGIRQWCGQDVTYWLPLPALEGRSK